MLHVTQLESGIVDLSGSLTIHTAEQLHRDLKSLPIAEDVGRPLLLTLEKATEIDLAGMQMLLAFKLSRPRDTIRFLAPDPIRKRFRTCGLDKYIF